jgi:hypothetical protein
MSVMYGFGAKHTRRFLAHSLKVAMLAEQRNDDDEHGERADVGRGQRAGGCTLNVLLDTS